MLTATTGAGGRQRIALEQSEHSVRPTGAAKGTDLSCRLTLLQIAHPNRLTVAAVSVIALFPKYDFIP
jgi:hypothetical protein